MDCNDLSNDTKITILTVGVILVLSIGGAIVYKSLKSGVSYPKDVKWARDSKTLKLVEGLHPKVRQRVADFFTDIEKKTKLVPIATSGTRTTAQQATLDKQNPNNADAGMSDHEYGFAIDINAKKDGEIVLRKSTSKSGWINSGIVDLAKKRGLKWGGNFLTYYDPIHFYDDFGIPANQMAELVKAGKTDKNGFLKV